MNDSIHQKVKTITIPETKVIKPTEKQTTNFHKPVNHITENKVFVSCQDIRNLASTLYLKSLPGLEEFETDYDILINEFYEPIHISD